MALQSVQRRTVKLRRKQTTIPVAPLAPRVRRLAASREPAPCLFKSIGSLLTLCYVQVISYAFIFVFIGHMLTENLRVLSVVLRPT